jgi:hypothetical protein
MGILEEKPQDLECASVEAFRLYTAFVRGLRYSRKSSKRWRKQDWIGS